MPRLSAEDTPPFSFSMYRIASPYDRAISAVAPSSREPSLTTMTSTSWLVCVSALSMAWRMKFAPL